MIQPWVLDINMMYVGSTIHVNRVGALSLTHMGYGDMEVTSMTLQEGGNGENFSANEYSAGITYSRKLLNGFLWSNS